MSVIDFDFIQFRHRVPDPDKFRLLSSSDSNHVNSGSHIFVILSMYRSVRNHVGESAINMIHVSFSHSSQMRNRAIHDYLTVTCFLAILDFLDCSFFIAALFSVAPFSAFAFTCTVATGGLGASFTTATLFAHRVHMSARTA